ncbi:MAG: nucleoside triphosphate pyrophosphohydrolase [Deltaproteobacteria bacterium]|nr:nucleoside triphosphate pyrophosphohydrolase [Deltaproteobacteria bacterium]
MTSVASQPAPGAAAPGEAGEAFEELCRVMDRLRTGCPWDRVQTHETLKPYLLEETYEVLHAMDAGDVAAHREELGDLLFQVVFHARVASEQEDGFNAAEVCRGIRDKLVRRHPHVFGADAAREGMHPTTAAGVLNKWEQLKRAERGGASILSGVPPALPALLRAQRVGEKAARVGFDWKDAHQVIAKVREELAELEQAMAAGVADEVRHELGDLLFATVQLARLLQQSAEDALRLTIERFTRRFMFMEDALRSQGRTPEQCTMDELNALWDRAKAAERAAKA